MQVATRSLIDYSAHALGNELSSFGNGLKVLIPRP